jgi:hypothetical protein
VFNRTYFALFIGDLSFPVAFFPYDYEAEEYATTYYPQAPSIDIRPYELAWAGAHTDDRLRPNVFIGAEELPRH